MSARDTLLDLFLHGSDGSQPEFEAALDAYRAEIRDGILTAAGDPLEPLTDDDASQTFAEAVMATTDGTPFSYTDYQGRTVLLVPIPMGPA
jgi:hypothetical protein